MNNIISPQVLAAGDEFDFNAWMAKQSKPEPVPLNLPDDPVALSIASYEVWKMGGPRWAELSSVTVSQDHREQAIQLKHYYRDRLVIDALKNGTNGRSNFRAKLANLVIDELVITKEEIGMLYRLPYFYEEDLALDQLMDCTDPATESYRGTTQTATYKLIKTIFRSRRSGDMYDYWMTSDIDNSLYCTMIRHDNPLRPLFESVIKQPVRAQAMIYTKQHRGYHRTRSYYAMANFQIT